MYIRASFELTIEDFGKVLVERTFNLTDEYTPLISTEKQIQNKLNWAYGAKKATVKDILKMEENSWDIEQKGSHTVLERVKRNANEKELYSLETLHDTERNVSSVHHDFDSIMTKALEIIEGKRDGYGDISIHTWIDGKRTSSIYIGDTYE